VLLCYKELNYSVVGRRNWLCILSSLLSFWGVAGWMMCLFSKQTFKIILLFQRKPRANKLTPAAGKKSTE